MEQPRGCFQPEQIRKMLRNNRESKSRFHAKPSLRIICSYHTVTILHHLRESYNGVFHANDLNNLMRKLDFGHLSSLAFPTSSSVIDVIVNIAELSDYADLNRSRKHLEL
jgi:hypothetical protein